MQQVTEIMIREYRIMKNKYDFMGYEFHKKKELSFHHLVVPSILCREQNLGQGRLPWNGAILVQNTSHNYLHIIEKIDYDIYNVIKEEMIKENLQGYIDKENLLRIKDALLQFEKEHCNDKLNNKKPLIKEEYILKRVLNDKPIINYAK